MNQPWLRTWRLGVKSLLLHPLRSLLTVLGIFVGVASVIWLLAIGEGISQKAQEQIASLGAENIIIRTVKPSDEETAGMQGALPYGLTRDDFVRILTEPKGALTKQYHALLATESVELVFREDAIEALADYAYKVNQTTQNIGARRLYTIMEHLLEELSFEAPEMKMGTVDINAGYVKERLDQVAEDEDLSRFIL